MVVPFSSPAVFLGVFVGQLIALAPSDVAIITIYFLMVLGIGIYLRRFANSSTDFFMAGRDMTAWVAGLSFLSANLGAIELMGWAASTYQ
jgi:SSS family solute:Na+ symporter